MKKFLKYIVIRVLFVLTRAIIRKYDPKIVMVTGSVGKTSTKDACAAALSEKFSLRASEKSYNSEFGVPLTIIGTKNAWGSLFGWLHVFEEAFSLLIFKSHYPELLVLEVGADVPGDLAHILQIVQPDAVVVTRLPEMPVHVEAYSDPSAVREEEFSPARALPQGNPLIVCADDEYALALSKETEANVTTYGVAPNANVRIENDAVWMEGNTVAGMKAELKTATASYPFTIPNALGNPQLYAPAAAFTLACALGVEPEDILKGFSRYVPPAGRLRILKGVHDSLLIDDTYNASPLATEEALKALARIEGKHRTIVIFGDMLELGRYSVEEHERIGRLIAKQADLLLCVGIRAQAVATSAVKAGMNQENVYTPGNSTEAGKLAKTLLEKGDVVLIKGSQSIRMERAAKLLLADSEDASYLVRQEKEWLAK